MIYASNFKMNHTRYSTEKYISTLDKLLEESKVLNNSDSRVFVFPPSTALCNLAKILLLEHKMLSCSESAFTGDLLTHLKSWAFTSNFWKEVFGELSNR